MTTISLGQEKLRFDSEGKPYFEKTVSRDGSTEKVLPENATLPHVKELSLKVILKREGYSPQMERKVWYGLQEIRIAIPNEKQFKYYFLCYDKKAMTTPCVKVLSPAMYDSFGNFNSISWVMTLTPTKDSIEYGWVRFIGKPKTVNALQVQSLLQNKEALCIMSDNGELCT